MWFASNAPGPASRLIPATTSLTVSTTTAASGTPTPATAVAASTGPMTEAERRSVRRAYTVVDLRKVDPLPRFPFTLGQFITTCNLVLGGILGLCDDTEKQSFDRPLWVVGWDAPLQKCFRKALSAPQVMKSPLPRLIDDFFVQLRRKMDVDDSGPSAYKKRLSLLTAHFDDGDQGRAFEQLNSFGVPDLTEFSAFLRAFKQRVTIVQGTERLFKPSDAMVIEIVRGVLRRTRHVHLLAFCLYTTGTLAWLRLPCPRLAPQPPGDACSEQRRRPVLRGRPGQATQKLRRGLHVDDDVQHPGPSTTYATPH